LHSSQSLSTFEANIKVVFRRHRSQPVERVIDEINPVLRGWVNYFAVGHLSRGPGGIHQISLSP
jgi:hypothetical protein